MCLKYVQLKSVCASVRGLKLLFLFLCHVVHVVFVYISYLCISICVIFSFFAVYSVCCVSLNHNSLVVPLLYLPLSPTLILVLDLAEDKTLEMSSISFH